MQALWHYILPFRAHFYLAGSASVVNKILDLMPPLLVGWVIDTVQDQPPAWITSVAGTTDAWSLAVFLAVLAVAIFALESLFQWCYQYGFLTLAQKVQHHLRTDAYNHIQSREIQFFENHSMGETMTMLNDDVNQLERFLNTGFNELLQLAVLFVFSGFVFMGVSWELAVIGILPIPIILWGSLRYQKMISPRYQRVRSAVGALNSRLENNISGIQVIKSFTAEAFESRRVADASREYQQANHQAIKLSSLYVPLIRMGVAFGFGGVLLVGSYWVLNDTGIITAGELVLFSMMIQRLLWPLTRLGQTLDELERARASARRTFGLLDSPSLIQDLAAPRPLGRAAGAIAFEYASFAYRPDVPVLENLNFSIEPGETVGFAGATGAGKTTIIKLLLRLYDPTGGAVRLDQKDLRDLKLADIRRNIALVSQDVYLFQGTVSENIAYGLGEELDQERIEAAARIARLHEFVIGLPEGYQTIVGEKGSKLSGGQRQRLSIARAILKDAPIMLFDEATSSVDTETEREIQQNLSEFTRGKTAIIIAHQIGRAHV